MPITAICNHCGTSYTVAEDNIGRTAKCKNCQQPFTIAPSGNQPSPPAGVQEPANQAPPQAGVQKPTVQAPHRAVVQKPTIQAPPRAGVQEPATQAPPPDAVSATMMVRCPHCEAAFSLARKFVGHEINCLKCGVTFTPSKSGIAQDRKDIGQLNSDIAISGLGGLSGLDEDVKSSSFLSKWPTLMAFCLVAVFLIIFLIMIYKPS